MKKIINQYGLTIGVILVAVLVSVTFFALRFSKQQKAADSLLDAVLSWDGHEILRLNMDNPEDEIIPLRERYDIDAMLEIKGGKIRFIEVNCPDKICEKTGYLGKAYDTAVCLPNKVTLKLEEQKA